MLASAHTGRKLHTLRIMTKTLLELKGRAERAIGRDEHFIHDVASHYVSITGNVKHMYWFKRAVARYLVDNFKCWEHLDKQLDDVDKSKTIGI